MNRSFLAGWIAAIVLGISVLMLTAVPFLSEAASPGEFDALFADDATAYPTIESAVSTSAIPAVYGAVSASSQSAAEASLCQLGDDGIDKVRQHITYQRYDEADRLLATLLDDQCLDDETSRDQARFQHAYLLHIQEQPEQVIRRLDALETTIPVDDYARWLRAKSLSDLDRHSEAAEVFASIFEDDDSPLHWKARAHQSKSLVASEQWEAALPVVEDIVDRFPDYPRRHLALYHRAKVLENLDRYQDAAEAFQQAHFEFPFKKEGEQANERLQTLIDRGYEPDEIDPRKRYEKYRQLSIDKFWPLAHELLTELRQDVATPEQNSEFENEILQRIALNTYHSHDHEQAAEYFATARSIYEEGHTAGFNQRVIYRYQNFALARLGKYDEARQALEALYENSSTRRRNRAIAQFYERYGRYQEAYDLYEDIYTRYQKQGWHFSYLKYKTGRFEGAYDNLRRLARRSRGETRAKYLYWAARSLERGGNDKDAAELFIEISQSRPNSYYGLQSSNRLLDLEQRSTVDETFLAQADRVSHSVDTVFDAFEQPGSPQLALHGDSRPTDRPDPRTQPMGEGLAGQSVNRLWDQDLLASIYDEDCAVDDACTPTGLGLPFPTYGLTWNLGQPLLDARMSAAIQPVSTRSSWNEDGEETIEGLDDEQAPPIRVPRHNVEFPGEDVTRIRFNTEARIYWGGRHDSELEFANYRDGDMIGPSPSQWSAYDDSTHVGGLQRAVDEAGDLFPNLRRTKWLWNAGWNTEAQRVVRDVSLEFRALNRRSRPRSSPHKLPYERWSYHIDNRRRADRADYWGMKDDELRFPVPDDRDQRQQLLARQQQIHSQRHELEPIIVEALQEAGDYHMVRQHALSDTWWLRQKPEGEAHRYWKMAYPRAFPEQVIPLAEKHNVNPYMIWALMLVESSFNPDSISIADALGLLQVIPRTGLKIAALFGSDDFGPFDLLEAENSIEQGVFYFSRLVRKFHGQELFAFAGYNGGPHRVSGWLDMRGHNIPLDEFIEEVPFDESRGYAKKVLRFLHVYLRLYEGVDDGLYVGQNIRPDYLEQPDF